MQGITVDGPRHDADVDAYVAIDAAAFGVEQEHSARWMAALRPHGRLRFAYADGGVVGGYCLMEAGQYFGGRRVPAQCVVGVVVHPLWRRRGIAGLLMRDLVRVARDAGTGVAPLYAATVSLYRRWGWEVADRGVHHVVRTSALTQFRGQGSPVDAPPPAKIEALRRSYLSQWDGPLDRPDWWMGVEWPPDPKAHRFLFGWEEHGELTGFVHYDVDRVPSVHGTQVHVYQFLATTLDAMKGLLHLLGGNASMATEVTFHYCLPARSDLLYLLSDVSKESEMAARFCWMQRLIDVPLAMGARGWAAHAAGQLELAIDDPVDESTACLTVSFAHGAAEVTPGGAGTVRTGVGALSAWFSGTLRMEDAARLHLCSGPLEQLQLMDAAAGGRPLWMIDQF